MLFKKFKRVIRVYSSLKGPHSEFIKLKPKARETAQLYLNKHKDFYNVSYNRVAVRNQGTRWGSCSKRGNLNFHYKIASLEPELAEYIVVHELCHLKEFNHSKKFWELVERRVPNYKSLRKRLKSLDVK